MPRSFQQPGWDEDDDDAKTVLVARRPREAWEDLVDSTTPAAEARMVEPSFVEDESLDQPGRAEPPPVERAPALDARLLAVAIGVAVPVALVTAMWWL